MSDSKLRELERRWRETGTREDRLALARERVRSGSVLELDEYFVLADFEPDSAAGYLRSRALPERLELAARCGHQAAILATPGPVVPLDRRNLADLPRDAAMVVGAAAVRGAISVWGSLCTDPALNRVLEAVDRFILDPSQVNEQFARALALDVSQARRVAPFSLSNERAYAKAQSANNVAQCMCWAMFLPEPHSQGKVQHALAAAAGLLGEEELSALISRETLAWALEARQQLGVPTAAALPEEPLVASSTGAVTRQDELRRTLRALQVQGRDPYVRALLAIGRKVALPLLLEVYPEDEGGAAMLDALQDYFHCPCQDHRETLRSVSMTWDTTSEGPSPRANLAVLFITHLACDVIDRDDPPPPAKQGWQYAFDSMEGIYRDETLTEGALEVIRETAIACEQKQGEGHA